MPGRHYCTTTFPKYDDRGPVAEWRRKSHARFSAWLDSRPGLWLFKAGAARDTKNGSIPSERPVAGLLKAFGQQF